MKQYELLHSLFVGIDVSMKENVVHAMPFSPEDTEIKGFAAFRA